MTFCTNEMLELLELQIYSDYTMRNQLNWSYIKLCGLWAFIKFRSIDSLIDQALPGSLNNNCCRLLLFMHVAMAETG